MIPFLQRTILLPNQKTKHLLIMLPPITLEITVTFLHEETDARVGTNKQPAKPHIQSPPNVLGLAATNLAQSQSYMCPRSTVPGATFLSMDYGYLIARILS